MTKEDLIWLAGYLEGEGSFCKGVPSQPRLPRIEFSTTDLDMAKRVSGLFKTTVCGPYRNPKSTKDFYRGMLTGKRAAILMIIMYPYMSQRRQHQMNAAIASLALTQQSDKIQRKFYTDLTAVLTLTK